MIINRRTYHLCLGKFREALSLITQIRELSRMEFNKDFRILTPIHGHIGTIVLELEFADASEEAKFSQAWYPFLEDSGWIAALFQFVQSSVNELWTDTHEIPGESEGIP